VDLVLDDDGCAICPKCQMRIHCGTVGLSNLTIRHMGSKVCCETKAKCDKEKNTKNSTILNFFNRPKPTPIPSRLTAATTIYSYPSTSNASLDSGSINFENTVVLWSKPAGQPISDLLAKLHSLIKRLPASVPEASAHDSLAVFEVDPKEFDDPSLTADELWEATLNGLLKSVLGWGMDQNMDEIIRRGPKGLDGLASFVEYFTRRGVSEALFEGKLSYLLSALERK